jgi:hypothetical protein
MIAIDEIVPALRGAFRLLLGDPRGMDAFDCSIEGFWRSFAVILICLPVAIVDLAGERMLPPTSPFDTTRPGGLFYWGFGLFGFVVAWIAFPLVLAALARPLGLAARYVPYMVARNWTTPIAVAPGFVVTLGFALGWLPLAALGTGNLVAFGFNLFYQWRVTRIACAASPGLAGGLVALDTLLSLLVFEGADRLIGL